MTAGDPTLLCTMFMKETAGQREKPGCEAGQDPRGGERMVPAGPRTPPMPTDQSLNVGAREGCGLHWGRGAVTRGWQCAAGGRAAEGGLQTRSLGGGCECFGEEDGARTFSEELPTGPTGVGRGCQVHRGPGPGGPHVWVQASPGPRQGGPGWGPQ